MQELTRVSGLCFQTETGRSGLGTTAIVSSSQHDTAAIQVMPLKHVDTGCESRRYQLESGMVPNAFAQLRGLRHTDPGGERPQLSRIPVALIEFSEAHRRSQHYCSLTLREIDCS